MSKVKHTPGPWIPGSYTGFVRTRSGIAVAATYGQDGGSRIDDVMVANARLIAAAPDLLEALKQLVRWHGRRGGPNDDLLPIEDQEGEIAEAMRVIAKAEGRA